jgi:hypothetical protein
MFHEIAAITMSDQQTTQLRELVYYATLAPSSHNTQCWKFRLEDRGLSGRTTGNPSIPRWLGTLLSKLLFRVKPENDKNARHIRSSAGIAVFVSEVDDKTHWVEVGRCYERFALQATALGIRNAFANQPIEEASLRPKFARALGLAEGRPDLVVRFGRGPEMPRSLRRPLDRIIVA